MKRTIMKLMAPVAVIAVTFAVVTAGTADVLALDPANSVNDGIRAAGGKGGGVNLSGAIKDIINLLLFILGAIAVIMIVIGGIKYTTSNGDASNVKSAKDTIMYAVIGLVVAMLAYAIVNFVVDAF